MAFKWSFMDFNCDWMRIEWGYSGMLNQTLGNFIGKIFHTPWPKMVLNGITLWCHQTRLAGKSPIEKIAIRKSSKSMGIFQQAHDKFLEGYQSWMLRFFPKTVSHPSAGWWEILQTVSFVGENTLGSGYIRCALQPIHWLVGKSTGKSWCQSMNLPWTWG